MARWEIGSAHYGTKELDKKQAGIPGPKRGQLRLKTKLEKGEKKVKELLGQAQSKTPLYTWESRERGTIKKLEKARKEEKGRTTKIDKEGSGG